MCELFFRLSSVESSRSGRPILCFHDLHTSAGRAFALGRYTHPSIPSPRTRHDRGWFHAPISLSPVRPHVRLLSSPSARFPLPSPTAPGNKQQPEEEENSAPNPEQEQPGKVQGNQPANQPCRTTATGARSRRSWRRSRCRRCRTR